MKVSLIKIRQKLDIITSIYEHIFSFKSMPLMYVIYFIHFQTITNTFIRIPVISLHILILAECNIKTNKMIMGHKYSHN